MSTLDDSTYEEQLKWIRQKMSDHEAITMSEYATNFDYFEEEVAEIDFLNLVSKSFVPKRIRTAVYSHYELWKRYDGVDFWASRVMKVSETETTGGLVAKSVERLSDKEVLPTFASSSASLHSPSASTTTSRLSSKKRKVSYILEEPWHSLTNTLTRILNGEKISDFPSPPPSMDPIHALLFEHAVLLLKEYIRQDEQDKDIVLVKDAQVAMSCVLNIMSARACEYFSQTDNEHLIRDAESSCTIADFDSHDCTAYFRRYVEVLNEKGIVYLKKLVVTDRGALNMKYLQDEHLPVDAMVEDKTLTILELLCKFIIRPPFQKQPPSENDCLHIWALVLDVIADKVSLSTGEKVLKASKVMRKIQSAEHSDLAEAGRRVDCLFMRNDVELSNIEFKSPKIGDRELTIQNRKNVRLARCIQESHLLLGEKDPSILMADVYGFSGLFYQVKHMGDISVAGRVTTSVAKIPCTVLELQDFLDNNSLAILWNYMTLLEKQGSKMAIAKARFESARVDVKLTHSVVTSSRSETPTVRSFANNVTFTPSKKRSYSRQW